MFFLAGTLGDRLLGKMQDVLGHLPGIRLQHFAIPGVSYVEQSFDYLCYFLFPPVSQIRQTEEVFFGGRVNTAKATASMNFAPMLAVLFIGARMRALNMDRSLYFLSSFAFLQN